jgi:tetratricopeptide (TPR) repeat protein
MKGEGRGIFLIYATVAIAAGYSFYGIMQYYGYILKTYWSETHSLASRFTNSAPFAAYVNMNIFMCLGILYGSKRNIVKVVLFLFFCILLVALILTKSRIAWGIFFALFVYFISINLTRSKTIKFKRFLMIFVGIVIIAAVFSFFKNIVFNRIEVLVPTQFQSLSQRLDVWNGTIRLILHRPWGVGIGGFQYIYPMFRTHSDRFYIDYAHSEYLQTASDIGLLGLVVFCMFLFVMLRGVYRKIKIVQPWILGVFFGWLAILIQGMADFPLRIPSNAILFFIMGGLLCNFSVDKREKIIHLPRSISFLLLLLAVGVGSLYTFMYKADFYYRKAGAALQETDWKSTLENYTQSAVLMPWRSETFANRGAIYSLRSVLSFSGLQQNYRKKAIDDFERARKLNPYNADTYLNLAWLFDADGDKIQAVGSFRKAIEVNPQDSEYYFFYADYCLEHGFLDEAFKMYQRGLSLFINDSGTFQRRYGGVVGLLEKISRYESDVGRLRSLIPQDNIGLRLAFAYFLERNNKLDDSLNEYKAILEMQPYNLAALKAVERLKGR